ncbi:MAG: hypothetical protein K8T89_21835 [Planctomycetes bacterium]|nr:hypothetical protein [Planctomycetota bacterium]
MDTGRRLPKGLRRLIAQLSYEDKIRKFRICKYREPVDEDELEAFIVGIARELYNSDYEEWPEHDDELS